MTCLSQGSLLNEGYAEDFRALLNVPWPPPYDSFINIPPCSIRLESSVFSLRCFYIFGSLDLTKDCSSRFNTELHRMYPVLVLMGAACCCTIHRRLLPLLHVMQFCFEKVIEKRNFTVICFSRALTRCACPSSFVPFCVEPDL